MAGKKSFLGTGWAFPPYFGSSPGQGRVAMVEDDQDIHESLLIILSTVPGERIMQPEFGCDLKMHVFDELNESVVTELRDAIERAILFYEPRVSVNQVSMAISGEQDGRLDIRIDYTIRGTNTRSNMVYPFYFLEGTNVSGK